MSNWNPIETAPIGADVLVCIGEAVYIAQRIEAKTLSASGEFYEEWAEYSEEHDEYFCPSGWYVRTDCDHCEFSYQQFGKTPEGWLPLPEVKP